MRILVLLLLMVGLNPLWAEECRDHEFRLPFAGEPVSVACEGESWCFYFQNGEPRFEEKSDADCRAIRGATVIEIKNAKDAIEAATYGYLSGLLGAMAGGKQVVCPDVPGKLCGVDETPGQQEVKVETTKNSRGQTCYSVSFRVGCRELSRGEAQQRDAEW